MDRYSGGEMFVCWVLGFVIGAMIFTGIGFWWGTNQTSTCAKYNDGQLCVEVVDDDPNDKHRPEPTLVVHPPTPETSILQGR